MSTRISVEPATEAVRLEDAKKHLSIAAEDTTHDAEVSRKLKAARRQYEAEVGRSLVNRTIELRRDRFPGDSGEIRLPFPPIVSVTSIQYTDTEGDLQTLDAGDYTVDIYSRRILPAYGETWPDTRDVPNAVVVTYVAGYGAGPDNIRDEDREAILLLLGGLFDNRETTLVGTSITKVPGPTAYDRLMQTERVFPFDNGDDEDEKP